MTIKTFETCKTANLFLKNIFTLVIFQKFDLISVSQDCYFMHIGIYPQYNIFTLTKGYWLMQCRYNALLQCSCNMSLVYPSRSSTNVFGDRLLCNNCIFLCFITHVIWNSDIKYFFNPINGLVMKVYIFRGLNDGEKNYFSTTKYY